MSRLRSPSLGGSTFALTALACVLGGAAIYAALYLGGAGPRHRHERAAQVAAEVIQRQPEVARETLEAIVDVGDLDGACWVKGDELRAAVGDRSACRGPGLLERPHARLDDGSVVAAWGGTSIADLVGWAGPLGGLLALALLFGAVSRALVRRRLDALAVAAHRIGLRPQEQATLPEGDDALGQLGRDLNQALNVLREALREETERAERVDASQDPSLEALAEKSEQAVVLVDAESGRVRSVNAGAEQLLGWTNDAIAGEPVVHLSQNLFGGFDGRPRLEAGLEGVGQRRSGERFDAEASVSSCTSDQGDLIHAFVVMDVTDRRLQAENLEQIQTHLEQKVVERIAALSRTNNKLQREVDERKRAEEKALAASRTKSRFLAVMSHELRTPLNAIIGYAELVQEEAEDLGVAELEEDVDRILVAAQHLLAIIRDILALASVESGDVEATWEEVSLEGLVEDMVEAQRAEAAARGNSITSSIATGTPSAIRTDRHKLTLILKALLSNACKFTDGGSIALRVGGFSRSGESGVSFDVVDTGIGIEADQLDAIFESFTQADQTTTRRYEGTGLGLTIARRYSHMIAGTIAVTSRPGHGSIFTLELPIDGEAASPGG